LTSDDKPTIDTLPITQIVVEAPRIREDLGDLEELEESIQAVGLICPVLVTADDKRDVYHLIAGQRRLEACRELGWTTIPVIYRFDAKTAIERAQLELAENEGRVALTPFEKSVALARMVDMVKDLITAEITEAELRAQGAQKSHKGRGRPKDPTSLRSIAERLNRPESTLREALAHVQAVAQYRRLKEASQDDAVSAAQALRDLPADEQQAWARRFTEPNYFERGIGQGIEELLERHDQFKASEAARQAAPPAPSVPLRKSDTPTLDAVNSRATDYAAVGPTPMQPQSQGTLTVGVSTPAPAEPTAPTDAQPRAAWQRCSECSRNVMQINPSLPEPAVRSRLIPVVSRVLEDQTLSEDARLTYTEISELLEVLSDPDAG
jgi:ParB/RepB/Spo0J family partition protein